MINLSIIKLNQWFKVKQINHSLGDCYFASIGIGIGDLVQVIRKAPFNGALHIKNNLGAEFAVDAETASQIYVEEIFLP